MTVVLRLLLLLLAGLGAALVFVPQLRVEVLGPQLLAKLGTVEQLAPVLSGQPVPTAVAGGAFALLGVLVLLSWVVSAVRTRHAPLVIRPGQKPSRRLAARLMEAKRYAEAADMYRKMGHLHGLADALVKGGRHLEAAELLVSDGKTKEAAVMLEEAKTAVANQRAAELWLGLNNTERMIGAARKAAALYAAKGDAHAAVELLLRMGDIDYARQYLEAAAEAYARLGKHGRAADMFERFGDEARAAAAFEYEAHGAQGEKERRASALRAAKLYTKVADPAGCGRALELAGLPDKALEVYSNGGVWPEAARLLTAMGQQDRAIQLLVQKGLGHLAVAQLESQGDTAGAARAALAAGDAVKAAELFESIGDTENAYRAHVAGGSYDTAAELALQMQHCVQAAEIWELGGSYKRSADMYEKLGNHLKAAEMYVKAGDMNGAARNLIQEGRITDAASVLMGQGSPETLDVQVEVSRLLVKSGDVAGAAALLKSAVDARPPDKSAPVAMELSVVLESSGDVTSALAYAQLALTARPDQTEVLARVQQLSIRINADQIRSAYEAAAARQAALGQDKPQRYITESEIGRGAMGLVYRARDTVLNRLVALKRLPEAVASDPDARDRFLEEARAAAGLNHPNVVTVYDAGVELGLPYLAMELVDGTTLNRLLDENGPLPPIQALDTCAAVAAALDHAHQAGIVHRDVKPSNILISRDGRVKLTDFGIAALLSRGDNTGVAGTPYFMSPEQVRGAPVDGRGDIYALGCVLFALLTGKPPFFGGDVLKGHLELPPPLVADQRPDVPVEIDRLLAGCLAKDPSQRFQTAAEAAHAFAGFSAWIRSTTPGAA